MCLESGHICKPPCRISHMNTKNESGRITASKVTMPSGGGAIRSMSEPFKANSFTGTGGFSIPFSLPEARGFAPSIALSYDSGSGNGLFGMGFSMPVASVVRKTSTGIPRYDDTDVFILAGAGELLQRYDPAAAGWEKASDTHTADGITWRVTGYRPRVEGGFSIIEHWTNTATHSSYWKVLSANNTTSLYGISDKGRIYDPQQPEHIFEWLLELSYDAHGNKVVYNYKAGDTVNIPASPSNTGRDFTSQRYPDTIQYGNYFVSDGTAQQEHFAFEVVFDYGQMDKDNPGAAPADWLPRPDAFSSYKAGFEIRTARLCYGIYLRHNFPGEENATSFTAALLPQYDTTAMSGITVMKTVYTRGYRLRDDGSLWIVDTPATELSYQEFNPLAAGWQLLQADAPGYLNASGFIPADLDGIGIDGLLYSNDQFTGYLAPLGNGSYAPMRVLDEFPVFHNLQEGQVSLTSLEGNNVLDLVVADGVNNGFFEQHEDNSWNKYQPFNRFPVTYLSADKEMADLSGTGRSDLVFYERDLLQYYAAEGKSGYAPANYAVLPDGFPVTVQQSEEELTGFSDFLGDGLQHRFCLCNGSLTVWPCLGHGRFGAAVVLDNAPQVDGLLHAARVFLIDADGSGTTDIVYCYPGYARIWFNRNGNAFSEPVDIIFPGNYSAISSVTAGDVGGYGTTSIIFTVTYPEVKHFYYDFSNRQKPYLLQQIDNGAGGLSALIYTTSVLEQLRDRQEGRYWPARMPVAVSIVSETVVTDQVTGAVFTQRYRYHDGYFDTVEKEFRGFGYVETWDCEDYGIFNRNSGSNPAPAVLTDEQLWMPPIYTRSWFITGAYELTPVICRQYESDYFKGDAQQWEIPAITIDPVFDHEDALSLKQAYAALAGQVIRTEVYAADESPLMLYPYSVSISGAGVRLVQPRLMERYCSVMPLQENSLSYHYDRNPQDPVISQGLVLETDEYGHALLQAAISFPRRDVPGVEIYSEQQQLHIVISRTDYINHVYTDREHPANTWQYLGAGWQSRSYETGSIPAPANAAFTKEGLLPQVYAALNNPVTGKTDQSWSMLQDWTRSVYWNDEGTGTLPYGTIGRLALLHHNEAAALTSDEITAAFGDKVSGQMLAEQCGYVFSDNFWWNYGQMQLYNWSAAQFYMPSGTRATIAAMLPADVLDANGFNGQSAVIYDTYFLNAVSTATRLSGTITLTEYYTYDYQALAPVRHQDVNNNISEVLYDPLGRVIATTVYGQVNGSDTGDLPLSAYIIRDQADFDSVVHDAGYYLQGATSYFYYDVYAWKLRRQPLCAVSITRNAHVQEMMAAGEQETLMPVSISYSDGLGNTLQDKAKTTTGDSNNAEDAWLVSGATVYNNKKMPVAQYIPGLSAIPEYEDPDLLIRSGTQPPPTVIHYDAAGRVVRTDTPKGFFSKTIYTSWETISFDVNDTMPESPYYRQFMDHYPQQPTPWQAAEREALQAALPCYNTPSRAVTDNLGNVIRTVVSKLGAIRADTIPADVAYPLSPEEAWQDLLTAGYLATNNETGTEAWVTPAFRPYTPGFHDLFLRQFPNGERLEDFLAQSCMTSLGVYDIQGRQLASADARLFLKMVRDNELLFNFQNFFSTGGQALRSESVDAGTRWSLANIAGNPVYTRNNRGIVQQFQYDNLQRALGVRVTSDDGTLDNQVQVTVYGEAMPDAANYNLMGVPWQDYDEAGLSVIDAYNLGGQPLRGRTYLRADYKNEANWTLQAQQDIVKETPFVRSTVYNAAGQSVQDTQPDGTVLSYTFDINGRLCSRTQQLANPAAAAQEEKSVISSIRYNALGQRTQVVYGNGVRADYSYDTVTQQLLRSRTSRQVTGQPDVLQDLHYSYDPAGHTISVTDRAVATVYNKNQVVASRSVYTYDPLYRIIKAQGRTLPGLNKTQPDHTNRDSLVFEQVPKLSDLQNLVPYTEYFTYDFGCNMVGKRMVTDGGGYTQVMTVNDTDNRLQTMFTGNPAAPPPGLQPYRYDGNGNMLNLHPNSTAAISWNYLDHIAGVVNIAREFTDPRTGAVVQLNDAEYYQYNLSGNRVRKVTEQVIHSGAQVVYTEKVYLGAYQRTRTWTLPAGAEPLAGNIVPQSEKNTLMVSDGAATVLITHVWGKAPPVQAAVKTGDVQYRYQVTDPLDSVTMELTDTADIISLEQYYVYGGTSFTLARSQLEAADKELRFCGKERDALTGLYYYGARYYVTWICRWMSPDPAGPVDGPNLYEYVSSNPVNYNDPTGMGKRKKCDESESEYEDEPVRKKQKINKNHKRSKSNSSQKNRKRSTQSTDPNARVTTAEEVIDIIRERMGDGLMRYGTTHDGASKEVSKIQEIHAPKTTNRNPNKDITRHLSSWIAYHLLNEKEDMSLFEEVQVGIGENTIYIATNKNEKALNKVVAGKSTLKDFTNQEQLPRITKGKTGTAFDQYKQKRYDKMLVQANKLPRTIESTKYGDYSIEIANKAGYNAEHAEAKIHKAARENNDKLVYVGGLKRPCLCCFLYFLIESSDEIINPHVGAFWGSNSAALSIANAGFTRGEIEAALDKLNLYKTSVSPNYGTNSGIGTDTDSENDYAEVLKTRFNYVF